MTNYATIPISSSLDPPPSSNKDYINQKIEAVHGSPRPWQIMFDFQSFRPPTNVSDAISRIQINISYFRINYAIIVFSIPLVSLVRHPFSLIIFVVARWLFFRFLRRQQPVVVFGSLVDDRTALIAVSTLTVLLLSAAGKSAIMVATLIGVVVHAAFRMTDDLFLDEEAATGLVPRAAATGAVAS